MDKIPVQQVARVLKRRGISTTESADFVGALFDVIKESLANGSQVKVRGLGTFKMVGVGARQSINVNTGERIVIGGHEKVSFVPDSEMREMVNKPFSLFDTVVLNEGVNFDDYTPTPLTSSKSVEAHPSPPQGRDVECRCSQKSSSGNQTSPPLEGLGEAQAEEQETEEEPEPAEEPDPPEPEKEERGERSEEREYSCIRQGAEERGDEINKTNNNMSNGINNEPRKRGWIVWTLLILLFAGGTYYVGYQQGRTNDEPEYVEANAPKLRPDISSEAHGIADAGNLAETEQANDEDWQEEDIASEVDAEAEAEAEKAKEEALKAEKEKAEKEKAEREKAEREKAEKAREEALKAEKARAEKEKAEKAKAERERAEREKAEKARAEKAKADALKAEKARAEKEKAEKAKAEKARAEKEKAEKAKAEKARAEKEKAEKAKAEKAKADALKAEKARAEKEKTEKAKAEKAKAEKAKAEKAKAEKAKADKAKADAQKAQTAKKTQAKSSTKKEAATEDGSQYEAMDSRLSSGSYTIVGTDRVVTVRRGEDLYRIARRELGNTNLVSYLSVFNGMTDDQELVEGQQIKIPKLKWKVKGK